MNGLHHQVLIQSNHLEQIRLRNRKTIPTTTHNHHRDDCQSQRYFNAAGGALANFRRHVYHPADLLNLRLHHVHSDAATRNIADFFRRGEARLENQVHHFLLAHRRRLFWRDQVALQRTGLDALHLNSAAVIDDFNGDQTRRMEGTQKNAPLRILARGLTLFGRFHAVIHAVTQQMGHWIFNRLNDRAIQFRLRTFGLQSDLLSAQLSKITHRSGQFAPERINRLDARLHHAVLQLGGDVVEPVASRLHRNGLQRSGELNDLVAGEHEFTDQIHQAVQQFDVHTHGGVGRLRPAGRVSLGRLRG